MTMCMSRCLTTEHLVLLRVRCIHRQSSQTRVHARTRTSSFCFRTCVVERVVQKNHPFVQRSVLSFQFPDLVELVKFARYSYNVEAVFPLLRNARVFRMSSFSINLCMLSMLGWMVSKAIAMQLRPATVRVGHLLFPDVLTVTCRSAECERPQTSVLATHLRCCPKILRLCILVSLLLLVALTPSMLCSLLEKCILFQEHPHPAFIVCLNCLNDSLSPSASVILFHT